MKCHVIDDRCQPLSTAAKGRRGALLNELASLTTRLFRYRFQRARLFDLAASEHARKENT